MELEELVPVWRVSWVADDLPHHLDTADPSEAARAAAVLEHNKIQPRVQVGMGVNSPDFYPWDLAWL